MLKQTTSARTQFFGCNYSSSLLLLAYFWQLDSGYMHVQLPMSTQLSNLYY